MEYQEILDDELDDDWKSSQAVIIHRSARSHYNDPIHLPLGEHTHTHSFLGKHLNHSARLAQNGLVIVLHSKYLRTTSVPIDCCIRNAAAD